MAGKATETSLSDLHGLVAEVLVEQINAWKRGRLVEVRGEEYVVVFPAPLLAQATKFLKDNGIDQPRREGNRVDTLSKAMPDFDELEFPPATH